MRITTPRSLDVLALPERIRGWLTALRVIGLDCLREFSQDDGATRAAAIGYYILFSLFPMMVLLAFSLLLIIGPVQSKAQVLIVASRYLPTELGVVSDLVDNVLANRRALGLVAMPTLLWSSLQMFRVLERAINRAWGAPRPRNFWHNLRFALRMVVAAGSLTFLSLMLSALFNIARTFHLPFVQWQPLDHPVVWWALSSLPPFLLMALLFTLLYRTVPRDLDLSWGDVLPGGVAAALLWEVAKKGFGLYFILFARNNYNALYGSVGALLALMTWAYVTGFIIVLGAEFCAAYVRYHRAEQAEVATQPPRAPVWRK